MRLLRLSSSLSPSVLRGRLQSHSVLALEPDRFQAVEEFELAYQLARRSFRSKTNLAQTIALEMLLWISGKRDIRRAFAEFGFGDPGDFLLVVFDAATEKRILKELEAKRMPLGLAKKADWEALERISLGRI